MTGGSQRKSDEPNNPAPGAALPRRGPVRAAPNVGNYLVNDEAIGAFSWSGLLHGPHVTVTAADYCESGRPGDSRCWEIRSSSALLAALLLAGSSALATPAAWSQVGSGYAIPWMSVDGGGSQSGGGNYTVTGTIGQAEAGKLDGGGYDLYAGFGGIHYLAAGPPSSPDQRLFLPLVLK